MSPLMTKTLQWIDDLYLLTGREPKRLVLPSSAYEMLVLELADQPRVTDGDPISGIGTDSGVWLACTELVADTDEDPG